MKQVQDVKPDRAKVYEQAMPELSFEFNGTALARVGIKTPIGPIQIAVNSYSCTLQEPATRRVKRVTIVDSRGQFPDCVKDFEQDYSRDSFVGNFDSCDGRFSLAVSDFEEPCL